ncbi:MAG: molybdopterin molybdotransferase MoeA [Bacteroidota bacterium]
MPKTAISVETARSIVLGHPFPIIEEEVYLHHAGGRVLTEAIVADRDFPAFDRVSMDGIVVQHHKLQEGQTFKVQGVQLAGMPAMSLQGPAYALEIMTGAVCPPNGDTVIPVEQLTFFQDNGQKMVRIGPPPPQGKNIHLQGFDRKEGEVLITPGTKLGQAEAGVCATVGKQKVKVARLPKVAVISTGDELVEVHQQPAPYQIRMSNGVVLQAALQEIGIDASFFHLTDELASLTAWLGSIMEQHDVLLLSGGVSKGKADHIPQALEEVGVKKHFHRVSQRPGKPFWFGTAGSKTLFAFPGNPVSTFVNYHVYFLPWLRQSLGLAPLPARTAILAQDVSFKPALTNFLQVRLEQGAGAALHAHPQKGKGSGDLANLLVCDALLELPNDGRDVFTAGDQFSIIPVR